MTINWIIREARTGDVSGLRSMMRSAYSIYQDRMNGERLPPMDADYSTEIADFPCWVAEANGDIVAGLIMVFTDDSASIANIAVHSDFQGQGVGGGLMTFAEKMATERGYSKMQLATHVLLTENISLYKHLGWSEMDRDSVRVYMHKQL